MKYCNAKGVACIASIVQQLLQMLIVVLIDISFEVMKTLVALVMTILFIKALHCCVRSDIVTLVFFQLIIEILSKKV